MIGIAVLACAYVLSQFFRSFLAVMAPELLRDLGVSGAQLSTAASIWLIAFGLMQFPVGAALDRVGPRRTAAATLLLAVAGSLVLATASGPVQLYLSMALIGVGCAAVLMSSFVIFARSFPPRRFALLSSWFVAFGLLGGVLGSAPLAMAVTSFGWRSVMVALAGLTLLAAAAIFLFVRDLPNQADSLARGSIVEVLRIRQLWPLMAMAAVAYAPASNFRGLWAGPFLADVHGFSTAAIGDVTFFMAVALIGGTVIHGPLDAMLNTRKWIVVVGSSVTALCAAALAVAGPASAVAASTFLVIAMCFGSNYSLVMAHARGFLPAHLLGRGVTLMNFFSIGGAGVVQLLSGGVFDAATNGADPSSGYRTIFLFYAGLLVIGLSIYVFSRDTRPSDELPVGSPR